MKNVKKYKLQVAIPMYINDQLEEMSDQLSMTKTAVVSMLLHSYFAQKNKLQKKVEDTILTDYSFLENTDEEKALQNLSNKIQVLLNSKNVNVGDSEG